MGHPSEQKFIPGFTWLAPSIWVQDRHMPVFPIKDAFSGPNFPFGRQGTPAMILITSWTGAHPKHIAKYTEAYNEMYPYTPIMVVTTSVDDLLLWSTEKKVRALTAAVGYIQGRTSSCGGVTRLEEGGLGGPQPSLLLHAFSEGGSNKAVCVARAYLAATRRQLPVGAFVFDSTPGTAHFMSNVNAFKRSLPQNVLVRALGIPIGFVLLVVAWALIAMCVGYENNTISKTRRALNDEGLWPCVGVPRSYVFSEADDLVRWKDVEDHAEESARRFKIPSLVVRYKKTAHCNHAREDPHYYWSIIRMTWESRDVERLGSM
ncbi:hypothetical protein PG999_009397 [Apiospora kogelbergensis]|uniref:Indole-diterpene biosynthesis protein PaxU n=1 Tax=Apiospora kogelbergensis TaxID=1337665 RepID=A0AAW0QL72_9PEZI